MSGLSPGRAEGAGFPNRFKGFCALRLTAQRLWVYISASHKSRETSDKKSEDDFFFLGSFFAVFRPEEKTERFLYIVNRKEEMRRQQWLVNALNAVNKISVCSARLDALLTALNWVVK